MDCVDQRSDVFFILILIYTLHENFSCRQQSSRVNVTAISFFTQAISLHDVKEFISRLILMSNKNIGSRKRSLVVEADMPD